MLLEKQLANGGHEALDLASDLGIVNLALVKETYQAHTLVCSIR
jgi:hypothetical protein